MKQAMIPADWQNISYKPRRQQKQAHSEHSPGLGGRHRTDYDSGEDNLPPRPGRGPWEPQAGVDYLPLGKRQVMEKFFTPVHIARQEDVKTREHHHYLPHHHHHHEDLHQQDQDKESQCYATPGGSNGSMSQGHVHHRRHGHHTPEDLDHPQTHPHHYHPQHHSHSPHVASHDRSHSLDPAASSSYSTSPSSSTWSSEASIDNETFLVDGGPGPRHAQSCGNIPGDRRGFWDEEEEEAKFRGLEGRDPRHHRHQQDHMQKLHRGHSKSEEGLLQTNGDESARPRRIEHGPLYKSASLGRSLAFSDSTEILLGSGKPKKAASSIQLPSKGILKNKQGQGGESAGASNIRKAKSLEVLSTLVERTRGVPTGKKGATGKAKPGDEHLEKKRKEARQNFVQGKLQFSAFLNEITRQVISPLRLNSLGVTDALGPPSPGQVSPKSPRREQRVEGKRLEGGQVQRQQKSRADTPDSAESSVHSHSSKYSNSSKHRHQHRHSIGGSPLHQPHHLSSQTDTSTTSPENSLPQGQGQGHRGQKHHQVAYHALLTDGTNTSPELSPHPLRHHHSHHSQTHHHPHSQTQHQPYPQKHHHRRHGHRSPSPLSPYHYQTHQASHKDAPSGAQGHESDSSRNRDATSTASPSSEQSDRHKHPTQRPSATQHKDTVADVDKVQSLQEQNQELRHNLLQTVVRMECMEAELQRTQEELGNLKDRFRRLQDTYTSSQQTSQLLEQKLYSVDQSMDVERKCLTQRISELSRELATAQTTIASLENINVPSLLQELLDKHFKSKEAVKQFLLPAIVPTQFKEADQSHASEADQSHAQGPEEEEHGGSLQQGLEGGQHRITAFQPWKQEQGHQMGAERDQKGRGDVESQSVSEMGARGQPFPSLQVPHLQFSVQWQNSLMPTAGVSLAHLQNSPDGQAGGGHSAVTHRLGSPVHPPMTAPEEGRGSGKPQQCDHSQNWEEPGLAATTGCAEVPLDAHHPAGGTGGGSKEDEITRSWRMRNSQGKTFRKWDSLENDSSLVTYQSAQRMLDNFIRHLQPPEEDSEGGGGVKGWAPGPREEALNGERKQL